MEINKKRNQISTFFGNLFEIKDLGDYFILKIWQCRAGRAEHFVLEKNNPKTKSILTLKSFNVLIKSNPPKHPYCKEILTEIIKAPNERFAKSWNFKRHKRK